MSGLDRVLRSAALCVVAGLVLAACSSKPPTTQPESREPPGEFAGVTSEAQCTAQPALKLTWATVDNATSYIIERDYVELSTIADGSATEYLDLAVSAGSTYTYRLYARNGHGMTSSRPLTATVPFDTCRAVTTAASAWAENTLIVTPEGEAWTFGSNWAGQLGAGDLSDRLLPVRVTGLNNVVSAALGTYHALALDSAGQVWAWGDNYSGQIGLGRSSEGPLVPALVPGLPEVSAVAAGAFFSLALATDGTVWAWGDSEQGQLGLGIEVQLSFEPTPVPGLEDVVAVFAGRGSGFALHANESLSVWGRNDHGQLGLGDTVNRYVPETHPTLTDLLGVASGNGFTLFQHADGTVWGSGAGEYLASGLSGDQPAPVEIAALEGVRMLAAGSDHSLAVRSDGTVLAWGDNTYNQVGESAAAHVDLPEPVPGLTDVAFVTAGSEHSVAVLRTGEVMTWGSNDSNQLGWNLPATRYSFVPVELPADVAQLSTSRHSLALLSDGSVWAWGTGSQGQIGNGTMQNAFVPVEIEFPAGVVIEKVSAGGMFSLALDNTGMIWSWGDGSTGALGHGDDLDQLQPVQITTVAPLFTEISAGRHHALALDHLGDVWVWGLNHLGQLGLGHVANVNVPTRITTLADAARVSAGWTHSAVVLANGQVWSFGSRVNGTMGDGAGTSGIASTPVMSNITDVAEVTTALNLTIALKNDGTLSSWGYNYAGRLGLGHDTNQPLPVSATGLADITQVTVEQDTGLAVDTAGNLYGWGEADQGQLGTDQLIRVLNPQLLTPPAAGTITIASGYGYSLLSIDGQVYGTGHDFEGQLGQGRVGQRGTPEVVEGLPAAATDM